MHDLYLDCIGEQRLPLNQGVYRPQFLRHLSGAYAARAAGES